MNIFKVSEEKRREIISDILNELTPEQLLEELIECGLEMDTCQILDDEILKHTTKYQEEEYYSIKSKNTWLDYIRNRTRSKGVEYIVTKSNKEMVA